MPYYELLLLASGRLNRKELTEVIRKTCRAFMDNGATVTRIAPLGADGSGPRKLAYGIRRNQVTHSTGFYVNVCAFSSPTTLDEVRRQLRLDERTLRHTVLRHRTLDVLNELGDIDDLPPVQQVTNPNDPQYELRKVLDEFQRDFPDGINVEHSTSTAPSKRAISAEVDSSPNGNQENSVRDILARMKLSPPSSKKDGDTGLAWLSKLNKPEPPDASKP